jgi:hypothetical protein
MSVRVCERFTDWPGFNSVSRGESGEIKELTKPVVYPGPLLLDGEFDSPPSPPEIFRRWLKELALFYPMRWKQG